MIEWPWLMIILALISTVQWPNSRAQQTKDYTSYRERYLQSSARIKLKRAIVFEQDTTATTAIMTSSYKEVQKDEPIINTKIMNARDLPSTNLTKSLFKNGNTTNNNKKQSQKKPSSIIFPTERNQLTNRFIPERQVINKCSMNETFCTEIDNYPRQHLFDLLRVSKYMSTSFFETDTINEIDDIKTKFFDNNLQSFCESKEEVIFPLAGMAKNNEWLYILQDSNNESTSFRQGIRVEKCVNAGTKCTFDDLLPNGYTTTCVQKYIYKKLVAVKDNQEIYYESFKLPSCCVCMYSNNPQILTRKGNLSEELDRRRFHQNQSETSKRN